LREAGHDAQAAREVGVREAEDGAICRYAQAHGLGIVTNDEDFAQRAHARTVGPVIAWLRTGNTSNAALRPWFIPQPPDKLIERVEQGCRVAEVR